MVIMAPTTSNFVKSPMDCARKRKLDDDNNNNSLRTSPSNKRCKRDTKKSKTTREQERLLLENFVKYGILTSPSESGTQSDIIPLTIPCPLSPLRTPGRRSQDSVTSPATKENTKVRSPTSNTCAKKNRRGNDRFWRPWLCSSAKNATMPKTGLKDNKAIQNYIAAKRNQCVTNAQQTLRHCQNGYLNDGTSHRRLTQDQLVRQALSPACRSNANVIPHKFQKSPTLYNPTATTMHSPRKPVMNEVTRCHNTPSFTPTVKKWDTTSPEFLNSFKQPVKLMWPRSRAFDYKYKDAEELLRAFPVQAAIGFYDDSDDNCATATKRDVIIHQRHMTEQMLAARCMPVMN